MREHVEQSDLTALLIEADDALRAIRHGNAGLQPDMDPAADARRLADAWKTIYELAERAYPGATKRER